MMTIVRRATFLVFSHFLLFLYSYILFCFCFCFIVCWTDRITLCSDDDSLVMSSKMSITYYMWIVNASPTWWNVTNRFHLTIKAGKPAMHALTTHNSYKQKPNKLNAQKLWWYYIPRSIWIETCLPCVDCIGDVIKNNFILILTVMCCGSISIIN